MASRSTPPGRPSLRPDAVRAFLGGLGCKVPASQGRAGWMLSSCPWGPWSHQNGKSAPDVFAVKLESGDPKCSCFACGWYGHAQGLLLELRARNKIDPRITAKWGELSQLVEQAEADAVLNLDGPDYEEIMAAKRGELHPFPEWWLDSFLPVDDCPDAVAYLHERGVSPGMALELGLRFDSRQDHRRVCFPVRNFGGTLAGFHGRSILPEIEPRYKMYKQAGKKNPIVWLGENWVDTEKPIVVVEGPFDLASVKRVYANVVSPLSVSFSPAKVKRMSDAMTWVTLFDHGTGGDQGRARVSEMLSPEHMIHHLKPPPHRKDPGECTEDELMQTLSVVD